MRFLEDHAKLLWSLSILLLLAAAGSLAQLPRPVNSNVVASGDLSGNYPNPTVIQLSGGAASQNIASAATIAVPATGNIFHVTGTTTITTVNTCNSTTSNRVVYFIFDGVLTFTDGNNLKLAGNFVTTADDAITLVCDSSNWYELARSVN